MPKLYSDGVLLVGDSVVPERTEDKGIHGDEVRYACRRNYRHGP